MLKEGFSLKIVVIHGSIRKGNTYNLTQEVIKNLKKFDDVEISEINISDLKLPFCVSCHGCFKKGEEVCPHYEIIQKVSKSLEESDGIILTGVVYSIQLNAAMKNLIDHLSYYFHRPRLFGKKGMVITTTAGAGAKSVAKYLKFVMSVWGIDNINILSQNIQTSTFSLTEKQKEKINKESLCFYNNVLKNKYKAPSFGTLAVFSSFRGLCSAEKAISAFDKNYWAENKMLEKSYPTEISLFKKAFGSFICFSIKKIMDKKR